MKSTLSSLVALSKTTNTYSDEAPFHASESYPEYPFPKETCISSRHNGAYLGVRRAFELLGLDRPHQGSAEWNPLRDIIRPGASVVVKPNWVHHFLPGDHYPEEILITHPSVIRAVLDYVFLACGPRGKVILGDAPIQSADFEQIVTMSRIHDVLCLYKQYHNFDIQVVDFRKIKSTVAASGRVVQQKQERTDPSGYRIVDIGTDSFFEEVSEYCRKFRVADYDPKSLQEHHYPGTHKYLVSGSVLDADAFVNVPKLKTHGKCGLTCSLKNIVGINGDKAYLPHFRIGSPAENGDDYSFPSLLKHLSTEVRTRLVLADSDLAWRSTRWLGRRALGLLRRVRPRAAVGGISPYDISAGHWFGNDTAWRMVLDLNVLLFFGDRTGQVQSNRQRQYISVIDAVIAGEGNGPLQSSRRPTGAILAGLSPVATDLVAAHLMGFNPEKIHLLKEASRRLGPCFPDQGVFPTAVSSDFGEASLENLKLNWHFRAPDGWVGHIERD